MKFIRSRPHNCLGFDGERDFESAVEEEKAEEERRRREREKG